MKSFFINICLVTASLLFAMSYTASSQDPVLGIFKDHSDIGKVQFKGTAKFNPENQEYVLEGAGYNIWFERDEFHYLWQKIKGDFILKAKVEFIGKGIEPHRKIGWMIRNDLSTGSPHVSAVVHGDGLTSLQYRDTTGGETKEVKSEDQAPDFIQLERKGNQYYMSTASGNMPIKTVQLENINLSDQVLVGLFICSHNPQVTEKAVFRQVKISRTGKKKQS